MRYIFGDYELDTQRCELRHSDTLCTLEPQAFKVLAYLIEHRDRVVPQEELLERLWPEQHVGKATLSQRLMLVRRAVGDSGRRQRVIKTLHSRGYRFIATVEEHDVAPTELHAPAMEVARTEDRRRESVAKPVELPGDQPRVSLDQTALPGVAAPRSCVLCQHVNANLARFCIACGAPLGETCAHCGHTVEPTATFCPACGQRLRSASPSETAPFPLPPTVAASPEPPSPASWAPVGERKLVTVLCGQLALAPRPEAAADLDTLHGLMQAVYALVQQEVHRYEGTLQPIPGASFLVLFGAPVAQEDHARRAVLTALGVQERVRQHQPPLRWPSGEAVVLQLALHTGAVAVGPLGGDTLQTPTVVGEVTTLGGTLAQQAAPETIVLSAATLRLVVGEVRTAALPPLQVATHATPIVRARLLGYIPRQGRGSASEARPHSPFLGREKEMAMLHARLERVMRGQGQVVGIIGEPGMGKSRLLAEFRRGLEGQAVTNLQGHCQSYGQAMPYLPLRDLLRTTWGLADGERDATAAAKVQAGLRLVGLDPHYWASYMLHLLGGEVGADSMLATLSPEMLKARTFDALHQLYFHTCQRQPLALVIEDLHWLDPTSEAYLAALVERMVGLSLLLLVTYRPGYQPPWGHKSYVTQIALQPLESAAGRQVVRTILQHRQLAADLEEQLLTQAQGNPLMLASTRQQHHWRLAEVLATQFPEMVETQPELLAHHSTEAGLSAQAIDCWQQAGQRAVERSAHMEAISHLTKGLELLKALPDTAERIQQELALCLTLGPALMATKGQGSTEVQRLYVRAQTLCQQVGDIPRLFTVLYGLWLSALARTELQTARELAEQLFRLAQQHHTHPFLLVAYRVLGTTLLFQGELAPAQTLLEQGNALYAPQRDRALAWRYGFDPGVLCSAMIALSQWVMGFPERARASLHKALSLAQELAHPASLALALNHAAKFYVFYCDEQMVQELNEAAIDVATEQEFGLWLAEGRAIRGWARVAQGEGHEGIAQIRQSLAAMRAMGELWQPYHLTLLAEMYGNVGQAEAGLQLLAEILVLMDTSGERWYEAETHRLRGELLMQCPTPDTGQVETCFRQALDIARQQQAKSLELRATMSLSRLWQQQGKQDEARQLLATIYDWFTEGFDTVDLQEAKALLDALG